MCNNIEKDFELEFCLSKTSYKIAYKEDGSLWDKNHNKHIQFFHQLFETNDGKDIIKDNISSINLVFFKSKKSFLNGFDKNEFNDAEYKFLKYNILK